MLKIYDVIIIGAGPAGLTAGIILKKYNIDYLIVEKGSRLCERDANNMLDISSGVGGGGLFSDGKFSFPPSGSYFWSNVNSEELRFSYQCFNELMKELNVPASIPNWDETWISTSYMASATKEEIKNYNSLILNSATRIKMIEYLENENQNRLLTKTTIETIKEGKTFYELKTKVNSFFAKNIIFANGRYGNDLINTCEIFNKLSSFSKIEIGVRLETESKFFKPYTSRNEDYKMIVNLAEGTELRTFCCCKDGNIMRTKFDKYYSLNGGKGIIKTNKSNIGILVRSTLPTSDYYMEMYDALHRDLRHKTISLDNYLKGTKIFIGENVDRAIKEYIPKIIKDVKSAASSTQINFPEIEYEGEYVQSMDPLYLNNNLWIAGDASGKFRGLLTSILSGIIVARRIGNQREKDITDNIDTLGINISNTQRMDLIFTAQSKKYFYCKDVICEYVLKNGKLPVNPFMIFGYFLNDRVERELVRQGNNQLIQSCDELWVFGPIADGVLFEIALAKKNNKPIRFFTIGTRCSDISEIMDLNDLVFESEVHSKKIKKSDLITFVSNKNIDNGQVMLDL